MTLQKVPDETALHIDNKNQEKEAQQHEKDLKSPRGFCFSAGGRIFPRAGFLAGVSTGVTTADLIESVSYWPFRKGLEFAPGRLVSG